MKYTFDDAYAIEFANGVLARLDRLLDIGIGHPSTLFGIPSAGYVDGARSRMLCPGTAVIFLKLLVKSDYGFQVRSRQWHHLVDSEGMSSAYHILDLH